MYSVFLLFPRHRSQAIMLGEHGELYSASLHTSRMWGNCGVAPDSALSGVHIYILIAGLNGSRLPSLEDGLLECGWIVNMYAIKPQYAFGCVVFRPEKQPIFPYRLCTYILPSASPFPPPAPGPLQIGSHTHQLFPSQPTVAVPANHTADSFHLQY